MTSSIFSKGRLLSTPLKKGSTPTDPRRGEGVGQFFRKKKKYKPKKGNTDLGPAISRTNDCHTIGESGGKKKKTEKGPFRVLTERRPLLLREKGAFRGPRRGTTGEQLSLEEGGVILSSRGRGGEGKKREDG